MRLNNTLVFFAQILLGVLVTPFNLEDAFCGNNQMQGTRITVNEKTVMSLPRVDIDGIAGTLGREHRSSLYTNLRLEDALHRNLIKPRSFGGTDIGHGSVAGMRLNNTLFFFAQILLGVLVTPFILEDAFCGNNQMQGTRITVNEKTVLSLPLVDIDGIAGTLDREHRPSRYTNLGLEDALHRNLIDPLAPVESTSGTAASRE